MVIVINSEKRIRITPGSKYNISVYPNVITIIGDDINNIIDDINKMEDKSNFIILHYIKDSITNVDVGCRKYECIRLIKTEEEIIILVKHPYIFYNTKQYNLIRKDRINYIQQEK